MSRVGLLGAFRRAVWLAAVPGALLFLAMQCYVYTRGGMVGADSHAYWMAARLPETWYDSPPAYRDAYLYAPVFAHLLWPLGHLPWPAFQALWFCAGVMALWWLLAPLGWRGLVVGAFCVTDLLLGNVYVFFAVALVLSLSGAAGALVVPLLTKVAPAVVGLWFVLHRDWGRVAWAAGTAVVVVGASVAIDPGAWVDWVLFLRDSSGERVPLVLLRLALAAAMVVVAARLRWVWLLAPALALSCPVLGGFGAFALAAAVPRLLVVQHALRERQDAPASAETGLRPEPREALAV